MNTKGERREYWQATEETLPIGKLEDLQGLRLRNTVERVYEHVLFYRKKLEVTRFFVFESAPAFLALIKHGRSAMTTYTPSPSLALTNASSVSDKL
jgi:hypothetical protein